MGKYISKTALVAEIEKCYNECLKRAKITDSDYWNAKADTYRNVLEILNGTIEVKEVDLWTELGNYIEHYRNRETGYTLLDIAEHFFELGLKAQKGM